MQTLLPQTPTISRVQYNIASVSGKVALHIINVYSHALLRVIPEFHQQLGVDRSHRWSTISENRYTGQIINF